MNDALPRSPPPAEERFRLLVESVANYAIVMLDRTGHVLTWNAGAERIEGYSAEEIIGRHFSSFYPLEALRQGLPARELAAAAQAGSFEDEGWRVRKDGTRFWANVALTALRGPDGELLGFSKIIRDLTQRRHHEESLRQSEERFRLLVEGVIDYAIFMLDVNGYVATWNSGAERIKGYAAERDHRPALLEVLSADARESGWPEHELQVAAEKGRFVDEGWRLRKDGTTFWALVTISALRDSQGKLLGFAKLTRDLTDRRRTEALEQAERQREEALESERSARMSAQRATRIKDEFLATLSHELRTPLSAITGWAQILKRSGANAKPEDIARGIDSIDRNAQAQVRLIDDMLDLSRIISGKVRLEMGHVSMAEVVEHAVESVELAARAKDIRLEAELDPAEAMLSGDAGRLQQVVWNLLSNAVKFTPNGGEVRVVLQRLTSHLELSVSDNGIGIPAEFLPHVFDRFSQQDSSTTRDFGGLGLGLAISKQLVELHGGSMRATSRGEGQGATFFVDLPLSLAASDDEREGEGEPAPGTPGGPSVDAPPLPPLAGIHVFVVDDEADARELLQRVLEGQSAKVTLLSSAESALEELERVRPQLIISDVGMPGTDGYQFMRTLRAREGREERIPALALTAFARPEDRKRSLLAGYQAHLAKPFDMAELLLVAADLANR